MNMEIAKDSFLASLAYLLRETFEGSPVGDASAYLDRGIGIFPTLEKLSASEASRESGGTTVAAHAEHARFYLDRLCEFIEGRTKTVDWQESWRIKTVGETEWSALRGEMRKSYENTRRCFGDASDWTEDNIGMAIAILTHTAYHLGAIRQIMKGKM